MIPLRDNIEPNRPPVVNYAIIALTTVVFVAQLVDAGDGRETIVERYSMIPKRVLDPEGDVWIEVGRRVTIFGVERVRRRPEDPPFSPWITLLTCIFLHGGWMHFLGNMWFLHIFGDNVEDRLGHLGYLAFYLGCGVAASAAHLFSAPESSVPTVGASGAIAGVMGAYFLFYPNALVLTLVPFFFFFDIIVLPAVLFLGFWFMIQLFQGALTIGDVQTGGVAWWAHVGGFVAGFVIALVLKVTGLANPPSERYVPRAERVTRYRIRRWD